MADAKHTSPRDRKLPERPIYLVHRVRAVFRETMDETFSVLGLNVTQCLILEALDYHGATSAAELARSCFLTPQALTAPLKHLVERGLVERSEQLSFGRVRVTRLTPLGQQVVGSIKATVDGMEAGALAALPPSRVDPFLADLALFADGWEQLPPVSGPANV